MKVKIGKFLYALTVLILLMQPVRAAAEVIDVYPEYYEEEVEVIVIDDWEEEETTPQPAPTQETDIPSFTWEAVPEETYPVQTRPPQTQAPPVTQPPATQPPETRPPETTKAPETTTQAPTSAAETTPAKTEPAEPVETSPQETTSEPETSPVETTESSSTEVPTTEAESETQTETLPPETKESQQETIGTGQMQIISSTDDETEGSNEDKNPNAAQIPVKITVAEGTALPMSVTLQGSDGKQNNYIITDMEQTLYITPDKYIISQVVDGRNKYLRSGMSFTVTPKTKELRFDFRKVSGTTKDRVVDFLLTNAWVGVLIAILAIGFIAYRKIFYDDEEGES